MADDKLKGEAYAFIRDQIREISWVGRSILRDSIKNAGLVLTGDLEKSIKEVVKDTSLRMAERYEAEIVFEFKDYMRYKDMPTLTYTGLVNTNAIKTFVEKVGVENFSYVSGRDEDPTQIANAASKIAWAIIQSRGKGYTVRQKASKRVYNKAKMVIINKFIREIRSHHIHGPIDQIKATLERM